MFGNVVYIQKRKRTCKVNIFFVEPKNGKNMIWSVKQKGLCSSVRTVCINKQSVYGVEYGNVQ